MTRSELILKLGLKFPALSGDDCHISVSILLDSMVKALSKGSRVEIRGFGSFGLNQRPPRSARNPRTGARVDVPRKFVPHFRPGKDLRLRVNRKPSSD